MEMRTIISGPICLSKAHFMIHPMCSILKGKEGILFKFHFT